MENFFMTQASWSKLFIIAFGLFCLYFALKFLRKLVKRASFLRIFQDPLQRIIRYTLLLYEMAVILILTSIFVMINPLYHGILLAIVLVIAYNHIKNYVSGRMIKMANEIKEGSGLQTMESEGIVANLRRLGLNLKTKDGIYFIEYSKLMSEGYTILAGEDIGGFYQLKITPQEEDTKTNHLNRILDLLITAPYLDWHHKPEVLPCDENLSDLEARVLVREEIHIHELVAMIKEWGYDCKII